MRVEQSVVQWWGAVIMRLLLFTGGGFVRVAGWLSGVIASPVCELKNVPYLASAEVTPGRV